MLRSALLLLAFALMLVGTPHISSAQDREQGNFPICKGSGRITCVVDGDTIWYRGEKIRIADINTPEVSRPACQNEAALARRATLRMQELLNSGPFSLIRDPQDNRDTDHFGRLLRIVMRDGQSLGAILVAEGLAEQWQGRRRDWCIAG